MRNDLLAVRLLTESDVATASELCTAEGLDADAISAEIASRSERCWVGATDSGGRLEAVHRALRWHRTLLFKGLYVRDEARHTPAGLRAAFGLRDQAFDQAYDGVMAWREPGRPETAIADRLRISPAGPAVHRYQWPFAGHRRRPVGAPPVPRSGTVDVPFPLAESALVVEMLGIEQPCPTSSTRLAWHTDRDRLVISGTPCDTARELQDLVTALEPVAHSVGARAVELLLPAADVEAALVVMAHHGGRLSRCPVQPGVHAFPVAPYGSATRFTEALTS